MANLGVRVLRTPVGNPPNRSHTASGFGSALLGAHSASIRDSRETIFVMQAAEHRSSSRVGKAHSAAGHTGGPTSPLRSASIKQWTLAGTNKFPLRGQNNESGTPMRT
jgi:hypothetical protein